MNKLFLALFLNFSITLVAQTNTWDGSTDGDWHKSCNWSLDLIPTCSHDVVIPTVVTYPTVTGTAHSKSVSITSAAANALTINSSGGGVLYIGSGGGSCGGTATDNGGCGCGTLTYVGNGVCGGIAPCDFFGGGPCGDLCEVQGSCICREPSLCISVGTCAEGPCGTDCYECDYYRYDP